MKKRYSDLFKSNVVQKVRDGKTAKEAAAESGVSTFAVRDWLKAADNAASARPMTPQEHAEVKRLRKENHELREERDILKKAQLGYACMTQVIQVALLGARREVRLYREASIGAPAEAFVSSRWCVPEQSLRVQQAAAKA